VGHERQHNVDVEALVQELRSEAADLRAKLDSSAPARGGAGVPPTTPIERLRGLADPRGGPLRSHRRTLGALALALKRGLIRLLTPIWDQQTRFHHEVVDLLEETSTTIDGGTGSLAARLDALDQRLVVIENTLARDPRRSGDAPGSAGFDYERFEETFRGAPERLRESQRTYLRFFSGPGCGPVLYLGCGNGIFLELLRSAGIEARGVDRSAGAVARCRAAGLDVDRGDLLAGLEACADRSLGAVVSIQVLEHLSLPVILRLLRVAKRKIRPGGLLLAETVNLASLLVFARAWTIDPTHRQPLHPLTLRFLVEEAGFSRSELIYSGAPGPTERMELPPEGGAGAHNAALLNALVFGPQDYAVVARA